VRDAKSGGDSRTVVLDRNRLLAQRTNLGWSQAMLASQAGVSQDTVSRAETGKPIRLGMAHVIASTYDVPLKDLLRPNTDTTGDGRQLKKIAAEDPYYRLYSNGVLVQNLDVDIPPYTEILFVVYPIAFPNEITNIQVDGVDARPQQVPLSNSHLVFSMAPKARKVRLTLTGM
jgi:transcriptional regulator with XRE-family HTH domain